MSIVYPEPPKFFKMPIQHLPNWATTPGKISWMASEDDEEWTSMIIDDPSEEQYYETLQWFEENIKGATKSLMNFMAGLERIQTVRTYFSKNGENWVSTNEDLAGEGLRACFTIRMSLAPMAKLRFS